MLHTNNEVFPKEIKYHASREERGPSDLLPGGRSQSPDGRKFPECLWRRHRNFCITVRTVEIFLQSQPEYALGLQGEAINSFVSI